MRYLNDPQERERLRVALMSVGVKYLFGEANGAGDSANEFWILALKDINAADVFKKKVIPETPKTWEEKVYTVTTHDGLTFDIDRYCTPGNGPKYFVTPMGFDLEAYVPIPSQLKDQNERWSWYPILEVVDLKKEHGDLEADITSLFDQVVDSYDRWDFNNDGSQGTFFWNLETNFSIVDASYNQTVQEEFGGEEVMGEAWATSGQP